MQASLVVKCLGVSQTDMRVGAPAQILCLKKLYLQTFEGTISKRSSWSGYANSVRKPLDGFMSGGRVNDLLYGGALKFPSPYKGLRLLGIYVGRV